MSRLFGPKRSETPPPPAADPPKAPDYMTKEEFQAQLNATTAPLLETLGALRSAVDVLRDSRPAAVAPVPTAPIRPAGISDDEIDTALMGGPGAAQRIRSLVDHAVTQASERLVREHIAPLRQFGTESLARLNAKVHKGEMPHYDRFKKEIEERLNAVDPEVRANPEAVAFIYDSVVGKHANELSREAAEEAVRKAQEPEPRRGSGRSVTPGTGAGPAGHRDEAAEIPGAGEIAGSEGLEALRHKGDRGQSEDEFAQRLGYKDWGDYMKMYNELQNSEPKGSA